MRDYVNAGMMCALIACSSPSKPKNPEQLPPAPCDRASSMLSDAAALRADGYLGRALVLVEEAGATCASTEASSARTELREQLWLTAERAEPDEATKRKARLLYQAGQILRERDGDLEVSLERFAQSYELWAHPLTIVQIGLTHRAAGREADYRRANARALAIAEQTHGAPAQPQVRRGHRGMVQAVAHHPSRPIVASGGASGLVLLWDLTIDRITHTLAGHKWFTSSVAFAPDGVLLVSGSYDRSVRIWDVGSGEELHAFDDLDGLVTAVAVGPDGKRVAAATQSSVYVWTMDDYRSVLHLGADGDPRALTFSPDGTKIAMGGLEGLSVWNVASGERELHIEDPVTDFAYGEILVTASSNIIRLWDADSGAQLHEISDTTSGISCLALSPDGATLVAAINADVSVRLWDAATGAELRAFESAAGITDIAFAPDGRRLISADQDETVRVWDVTSGDARELVGAGAPVTSVAFAPDGTLAAASSDDAIRTWNLADRAPMRLVHRGDEDGVVNIAISPDGARIAALDRRSIVLDAHTGDLVAQLGENAMGGAIAYSPDGALVATGGEGAIELWDASTGAATATLPVDAALVEALAFSPDGRLLASMTDSGVLHLWDVATATVVRSTDVGTRTSSIAFTPDGQHVAIGLRDNTTGLVGVASGEVERTFSGHDDTLTAIAIGPEGTTLATQSFDKTVKLWNLATGALLHTLPGDVEPGDSVAFSPGGGLLAVGGWNGSVGLWDVTSGEALATLYATRSGEWLAIATGPAIDGSDGAAAHVYWQVGGVQLPGFVGWQRYGAPGLMQSITVE